MHRKTWLPLGEILRLHIEQQPAHKIRDYETRRVWAERNSLHQTFAFYNCGKHIYLDWLFQPADSRYRIPSWTHLLFREYRALQHISGNTAFRSFGHKGNGIALFLIGVHRLLTQRSPCRIFSLPPLCIQYVAVSQTNVVDSLLVCQPLPLALLQETL